MNNFIKTLINHQSRHTGTVLTDEHYQILDFAYNYYEQHKVGPLYQNIKRHTKVTRDDIERLFPHGLHSVYTWVGIPIHSTREICKPIAEIEVDDYRQVYLDYNATTPIRPEVRNRLVSFYKDPEGFGNPSSSTKHGEFAYSIINNARIQIANSLDVDPKAVIFTGSGTEANNLALKGIAFQHLDTKGHIISSKIEHPSILNTLEFLESIGFEISLLDVDRDGHISIEDLNGAIQGNTILVAIMAANNEIGTINPIAEIGMLCQQAGIPLIVDAIQAFGKIALHPRTMGIPLVSISGHKICAPKGVGALYVEPGQKLTNLIHGGSQEFAMRAGTENVGSILAFGEAAQLIHSEMEQENLRLKELQTHFLSGLSKAAPGHIVNGPLGGDRLPNNLNIGFPNIDSGSLLLSLDQIGVFVSAGSACSAGSQQASHVIDAIGVDSSQYGIIRFSFGIGTTKEDIDYVLKYLPKILSKL